MRYTAIFPGNCMKATVIIVTYNKPKYLKVTLDAYRNQTCMDFDIIIADDGSTEETQLLIEAEQKDHPVAIKHVWHEDNGFQKCRILNKSIKAAKQSDYLIFSDDDCIPFPDFIEKHRQNAKQNQFLSCGAMRLPDNLTEAIFKQGHTTFNFHWLNQNGLADRLKYKRFFWPQWSRILLDKIVPIAKTFNGGNASAFKNQIIKVGGFDERMAYGGEDVELGLRLTHIGMKAKRLRHQIRALHLEHGRPYVNDEMVESNRKIRQSTIDSKRTYSSHHIDFD